MAEREPSFNHEVMPVLSEKCFRCHGQDAKQRKADLRLDQRDSAVALKAIVPGDASKSGMIVRLDSPDPDEVMPPPESHKSVTAGEKELLRRWIDAGAVYETHWAFVAPVKPPVPAAADGRPQASGAIDAFVRARLADHGLTPAPPASREEWLRRVSFALTGLPPTLDELNAFLADESPGAHEAVVDRLLASPAYGERMAADWLDAARYADTYGRHEDNTCATWPYRDWLIRMFNANLPYDTFVAWQTAGDLMTGAGQDALIGTAFNRLHQQSNEAGSNEEEFRWEHVFDRVKTNATAFLGLTLECARCHDHKYDPFTMRDYYQFAAFFNNIDELGLFPRFTAGVPSPSAFVYTGDQEMTHAALRRKVAEAEEAHTRARTEARGRFTEWLRSHRPPGVEASTPGFWQRLFGRTDGRTAAAAAAPVSHFPLDETDKESKVVKDAVNPSRTATTRNAFKPVKAKFGRGLFLRDDRDNQIQFSDLGHFRRTDPFSYSLWVKCPVGHDHAVILHHTRGAIDAAHRGYEMTLEDGKLTVTLAHYYPGNAIRVQAREKVSFADWTHLAFTYDGSSRASGVTVYVNGKAIDVVTVRDCLVKDITYLRKWGDYDEELPDLEIKTEATLEVGGRYLDRTLAGATIDELKIFDQTLSAPEVAALAGGAVGGGEAAWFDWYARTQDAEVRRASEALHAARRAEDDFVSDLTEMMVMREWDGLLRPTPMLARGQWDAPGEAVTPGGLGSVLPWPDGAPKDRLGLARWLTDPKNPLTARVAANRYWSLFFRRGLVATPEDFGTQGARPSHPELLDWLAVWLVENKWDLKAYCRMIALSETYRQSSVPVGGGEADAENVWLSRGPRFRLPAEQARDAALAVSGLLVRTIGGPSVKPYQPDGLWEDSGTQHTYHRDDGEKLYRRSLYTFWRRTCPPPMMTVLDAPSREFCRVRRDETLTPLQGLALLNETGFTEAARVLAQRMVREFPEPGRQSDRIRHAYRTATAKLPMDAQLAAFGSLMDEGRRYFEAHPDQATALLAGAGSAPQDASLPQTEVAATFLMTRALLASDAFVSSY